MLYTRKGDTGTTKAFDSKPGVRMSKSSCQTEALGSLDEINSFLGLVKVESSDVVWDIPGSNLKMGQLVHYVQENLFIIQAECAGFPKPLGEKKVKELETIIDETEKVLPPIKTFFISGGTSIAALFDICRTLTRRAERRVVQAHEEGQVRVSPETLAFLNRLSSLFYALARLTNHKSGIKEVPPSYN